MKRATTAAMTLLPLLALTSSLAIAETIVFPNTPLFASSDTATASGGGVALNSARLDANTRVFETGFNPSDWSGKLLAYPVSTGAGGDSCNFRMAGSLCEPLWDASAKVGAQNSNSGRTIVSYNPETHIGIPFRWSSLSPSQQSVLNADPATPPTSDAHGAQRLDWLRGSHVSETSGSTPRLRARTTVLGDIIDSSPFFVGAPTYHYGFDGYTEFRNRYATRTPMVYVAANDGMLHGFDASSGDELIAYVPAAAFGTVGAPLLTQPSRTDYSHTYIVDGSPTVADAWYGGGWHSVLAGGLGAGGQAVYTLDVTDPAQFSEANSASLVLWEFTNTDDPDLGSTLSQPSIVRTAAKDAAGRNRWAVVVSSGYNNTAADGHASDDGKGAVFLLFLDHHGAKWALGDDYIKLAVPPGASPPNGLGTPACVDMDGDGIVDRIYAGDLIGNLWRFDITNPDAAQWRLAYDGHPLFTATDYRGNRLPITERPEVGYNLLTPAAHDVVVYFGTGRYLSASDNARSGQNTQAFFAIFDEDWPALPAISRASLASQTILAETGTSAAAQRVSSRNAVDPGRQYGWYIDLFNTSGGSVSQQQAASGANLGERQISNPVLRDGRIIFATLIPPDGDQHSSSWLMELDARTGAALDAPTLDANNDRVITDSDRVSVTTDGQTAKLAVSGTRSAAATLSSPALLALDSRTEISLATQTDGATSSIVQRATGRVGRVSWRELSRN
jgi:type IV pilus assembly protein PilY1